MTPADAVTYDSVYDLMERLREYAIGAREPRIIAKIAADELEKVQHRYELAAAEAAYLRGEMENVQRDRMAQADNERLRELIKEWAEADSANDFMANDTAAIRYARAMEALREEANR